MKYDDASWHFEGDFPEQSPEEYGATHIALFLRWCFAKGWIGDLHKAEEPDDTKRMVAGELSATEYFLKYCDGKLTNEDLNEEGNAFAARYYGDDGLYLADYASNFGDLLYTAPESEHDFQAFTRMVDTRLKSGILTNADKKPWWKLW